MDDRETSGVTCVSGYWRCKQKHSTPEFEKWLSRTLRIKCPYVIFTGSDTLELMKRYRRDLPTHYVVCEIPDFVTYKHRDSLAADDVHCPSKELSLIYHEKVFMLEKTFRMNPFGSDFFCWIDAGICVYRNDMPTHLVFPDQKRETQVPSDKILFSEVSAQVPANFHQVADMTGCRHISGGGYVVPKNLIEPFASLYEEYLARTSSASGTPLTDEMILGLIQRDRPEMFQRVGDLKLLEHGGYGQVILWLAAEEAEACKRYTSQLVRNINQNVRPRDRRSAIEALRVQYYREIGKVVSIKR